MVAEIEMTRPKEYCPLDTTRQGKIPFVYSIKLLTDLSVHYDPLGRGPFWSRQTAQIRVRLES